MSKNRSPDSEAKRYKKAYEQLKLIVDNSDLTEEQLTYINWAISKKTSNTLYWAINKLNSELSESQIVINAKRALG